MVCDCPKAKPAIISRETRMEERMALCYKVFKAQCTILKNFAANVVAMPYHSACLFFQCVEEVLAEFGDFDLAESVNGSEFCF